MAKTRLDVLVFELGLFESRQAARTAIMDGAVLVDGQKMTKPGCPVSSDARVELAASFHKPKYVSRGGLKLEKALSQFQIDLKDRICLDIGASTGGFTDCMLQYGASRVYAIDVGYGQLDWTLRNDPRVVVKERVNARYINPEELYGVNNAAVGKATFAAMDLSFISLVKVIPAVIACMVKENAEIVSLVKPQFEAGRSAVGKGGVVSRQETHVEVLTQVIEQLDKLSLTAMGLTHSPVTGPAGNIEFLLHLEFRSHDLVQGRENIDVHEVVASAHAELRGQRS